MFLSNKTYTINFYEIALLIMINYYNKFFKLLKLFFLFSAR
jgi:hypothetical protein